MEAPWNASWTAEERFEVRPCRYAQGRRAIWQPHRPGEGRPIFAKPHSVRQRRSIAELRCTVCGEPVSLNDAWWFGLGEWHEASRGFRTDEAPVHRECAELAMRVCPHIRKEGLEPAPFPKGFKTLLSMIGGEDVKRDFGLSVDPANPVVGHAYLWWPWIPDGAFRLARREAEEER